MFLSQPLLSFCPIFCALPQLSPLFYYLNIIFFCPLYVHLWLYIIIIIYYDVSLSNFFRMIFGFQLLLIISLLCFNILIWESYAHMTFLQPFPQFFASSNIPFPISFFYQVWLPCLICLIQSHCFGHCEKLGILKPRYHKIVLINSAC